MAAAAAADASTNVADNLDVWVFEHVFYYDHPNPCDWHSYSGQLEKYATICDLESLRDATLKKEIDGLCVNLCNLCTEDLDLDASVEYFEKLKLLDLLDATGISLDNIRGLPELRVLICSSCALSAHSGPHRDEFATTIASLPKLRCIVTFEYEFFDDLPLHLAVFPVSSLRSLALLRSCHYDYSFLLHLPNLENLSLDLSNCEDHNALEILLRLPYKSKLLRFGTIDHALLQNVEADKLFSTAQSLLDDWPNLRQLSVDLPGFGVDTLRFPKTIRVLKFLQCGPFKLKALLRGCEQLKFLAVYTNHINSKDLKILRQCCRAKKPLVGNFKVRLCERFSLKHKYHFKLSKGGVARGVDDGRRSFFDFVHENLDDDRF